MIEYKTEERLTKLNAKRFERELIYVINHNEEIIINMEETIYISSIALKILLKAVRLRKDIKIINITENVRNIFEITDSISLLNLK